MSQSQKTLIFWLGLLIVVQVIVNVCVAIFS
jgi:hypothetical protein